LFVGFADDDFASVVALDCLLFQVHVWASRRPGSPLDFESAVATVFPSADRVIPSIARKLAADQPDATPSELRETLIDIWKRISTDLQLDTELKPLM
jgi:hypothetical protein